MKKTAIKLFEDYKIRTLWDNNKELWYFSVVDVIRVLTDSADARKYWSVLKTRLKKEGSQLTTNCSQLKMQSSDGKYYKTDTLDTQGILRLIQSVPSPKAEPFKLWLAKVGSERLDEIQDPEIAINRALRYYLDKGYTKEWAGMTTREYKDFKELKKESLRDNMSNMELVLNMLAEVSTTTISKQKNPKSIKENKDIAKRGGTIAKQARKNLELEIGKNIITKNNHLSLKKMKQIKNIDK